MKALFYLFVLSLGAIVSEAHDLDQHARVVTSSLPTYPPPGPFEAEKGIVSVLFGVNAMGDAKIVRVMCSSSSRFAEAAKAELKKWKFYPAKREGKPSSDSLEFILIFSPTKEVEVIGPLYES